VKKKKHESIESLVMEYAKDIKALFNLTGRIIFLDDPSGEEDLKRDIAKATVDILDRWSDASELPEPMPDVLNVLDRYRRDNIDDLEGYFTSLYECLDELSEWNIINLVTFSLLNVNLELAHRHNVKGVFMQTGQYLDDNEEMCRVPVEWFDEALRILRTARPDSERLVPCVFLTNKGEIPEC